MRVIRPIDIVPGTPGIDTILTSTNVLENDATLWSAGTINLGQQRIYNHRLYQVIANPSTTDQPDVGAAKTTSPTWLDLGAVNRWKMFDAIVNSQTTGSGTVAVTLTPAQAINALALLNLGGSNLTVTMTDPIEGVVFSATVNLQDNSQIVDGYSYCFEDIVQRRDVVITGMPSYVNAVLSVTVDAGAGTAKIGELVIGRAKSIGEANFGTSVGIQSYSVKDRDSFGNVTVVARSSAKRTEYDVSLDTSIVDAVHSFLTDIENVPCVFIGDANRSSTIVYGFFKDFMIVLEDAGTSHCSIEVEGLT